MTQKHASEMTKSEYREARNIARGLPPSRISISSQPKSSQSLTEASHAELRGHAERVGILNPEDLALADLSTLEVGAGGRLKNGAAFVYAFRDSKPHLFKPYKHARDMTETEFKSAVARAGRREGAR